MQVAWKRFNNGCKMRMIEYVPDRDRLQIGYTYGPARYGSFHAWADSHTGIANEARSNLALFPLMDLALGAYRCSTVPIFHSPFVHQSLCFPVPMFPDHIFPSSYVPQSLSSPTRCAVCFPILLFPSPDIPLKCFQSLCSPKMFLNPFVPQFLCSPVPMFPWSASSPYVP